MAKKIGIVLSGIPHTSETFIASFIQQLAEGGNKIYVFANSSNNALALPHTVVVRPYLKQLLMKGRILSILNIFFSLCFNPKRLKALLSLQVAKKQLLNDLNVLTSPSLDYLHFPFANLAFGREHYAEILGAKMTIGFRGSDINVFPVYHRVSYEKMWPQVFKVHCNAQELKSKLALHNIPSSLPVKIIQPGLRARYLKNGEDVALRIKKQDYKKESFLTVGRLHWIKDFPLLLRALALLRQSGAQFTYTIAGDGKEKEHLMFLVEELGLQECVHFAGALNTSEVLHLFAKATLYIQTSLAEGFSNACLEAQSQGLLCVTTNVSGMQTCIEDGVTGIVVKDRQEATLVNAIRKIMSLPTEERRGKSLYAANRARTTFTYDRQKQEWLEFFN